MRQPLPCFPRGVKYAGAWVGVSGQEAGLGVLGVRLWPVGCRLGMSVLDSWTEEQAGSCPVSEPFRSFLSWKLTAAAQLTQLLFGEAVGG